VVENSADISVQLSDGRSLPATLIGADPQTDLAVLKVDSGGLTAAPWGDSDKLEVGSLVWAIGNPFGLDRSVTFGIVSAKNRRAASENPFQDFLQTDAAVNPGNSGGPLVNARGQIVGINTAILGPAYRGVSFSIPSNLAREVYEQLRSARRVQRAWLGVALADLTEEIAAALGVKAAKGAVIAEIVPGGPADRAGLKVGDVVVQWNKAPVDNRATLSLLVARTPIDSKATAIILRGGRQMEIEVTVHARPVDR
jgi:serine protease Do